MRSAIIGFVVGAGWLQMQAALPRLSFILLFCIAGVALIAATRLAFLQKAKIPLLAAGGALCGFAWAALFAQHYLAQELPRQWEGRDLTIVGTIDSLPSYFERGVRFNFKVEKVLPVDGEVPAIPDRLALSWYAGYEEEVPQPAGEVHPGERWQLTVRLRRPHGNANPHGFDYEQWLLEQNVRATGYVRPAAQAVQANVRLERFVVSFNNVVERSRGWLRDRVQRALAGKPYAGVIVALVVGDQRALSQEDWTVFNRTGVGHLISML